jgi:hypothetical protein
MGVVLVEEALQDLGRTVTGVRRQPLGPDVGPVLQALAHLFASSHRACRITVLASTFMITSWSESIR